MMFESDDESTTSIREGSKVKKKENVSLQAWANYFCKNEQGDKQLQKILEEQFCFLRRMYCFLDESQIMGKTLTKLGIPNLFGKVDKRYLKQFLTCKKKVKTYEKLHKPPKKVTSTFSWKTKQQTGTIQARRYQPVAERWSDIAIKKNSNKIVKRLNTPLDKSSEYDYKQEESAVPTKLKHVDRERQINLPILVNNKQTQNIQLSNSQPDKKSSQKPVFENSGKATYSYNDIRRNSPEIKTKGTDKLLFENKSNVKKSVRFDSNLCSFAPTPEGFYSSNEEICLDGNLRLTKPTKPECEIQFDKLTKCNTTESPLSNIELTANSRSQSDHHRSSISNLIHSYEDVQAIKVFLDHSKDDQNHLKSYVIEPYSGLDFTIEDSSSSSPNLEMRDNVHSNINHTTEHLSTSSIILGKTVVDTHREIIKNCEDLTPKLQDTKNKKDIDDLSQDINLSTNPLMSEKSIKGDLTVEQVIIEATPSTEELQEGSVGTNNYSATLVNFKTNKVNEVSYKTTKTDTEEYIERDTHIPPRSFGQDCSTQDNSSGNENTRLTNVVIVSSQSEESLETAKVNIKITSPSSSTSDRDYISDGSQIHSNSNFGKMLNSLDLARNSCIDLSLEPKENTNRITISDCKSKIKVIHESRTNKCTKEMSENGFSIQNDQFEADLMVQNTELTTLVTNSGTSKPEHDEKSTTYETTPISQSYSNVSNLANAKGEQFNKIEVTLAPSKKDKTHTALSSIESAVKSICKSLFPTGNIENENNDNLRLRKQIKGTTEEETVEAQEFLAISDSEDQRNEFSRVEQENCREVTKSVFNKNTPIKLQRHTNALRFREMHANEPANVSSKMNEKLAGRDISCSSSHLLTLSTKVIKPREEKKNCEDMEYIAVSDDEVCSFELSMVALPKSSKTIAHTAKENSMFQVKSFNKLEYLPIIKENISSCEISGIAPPQSFKDVDTTKENYKLKEESLEETEYLALSNNEVLRPELTLDDSINPPKVDSSKEINKDKLESFDKSEFSAESNYRVCSHELTGVTLPKSSKNIVDSTKENDKLEVESFEKLENSAVSKDKVLCGEISTLAPLISPKNVVDTSKENNIPEEKSFEEKKYFVLSSEEGLSQEFSMDDSINAPKVDSSKEMNKNELESVDKTEYFGESNDEVLSCECQYSSAPKSPFSDNELFTNDPVGVNNNHYPKGATKTSTLSQQYNTLPMEPSFTEREHRHDSKECLREDIEGATNVKGGGKLGKPHSIYNDSLPLNENLCKSTFNQVQSKVKKDKSKESSELDDMSTLTMVETFSEDSELNASSNRKICEISQTYVTNKCRQNNSLNVNSEASPKSIILDKNRIFQNNQRLFEDNHCKLNTTTSQVKTAQNSQTLNSNRGFQLSSERNPEYIGDSRHKIKILISNNTSVFSKNFVSLNSIKLSSPLANTTEKQPKYKEKEAQNYVSLVTNVSGPLNERSSIESQSNSIDLESSRSYGKSSVVYTKNISPIYTTQANHSTNKENKNYLQNDGHFTPNKNIFQNTSRNIPVDIQNPKVQYGRKENTKSLENDKKHNIGGSKQTLCHFPACRPLERNVFSSPNNNAESGNLSRVSTNRSPVRFDYHTHTKIQKANNLRKTVSNIMQPSSIRPSTNTQMFTKEVLSLYNKTIKLHNSTTDMSGQCNQNTFINPGIEESNENTNCPLETTLTNSQYSEENFTSEPPSSSSNFESNDFPTGNILSSHIVNQVTSHQSEPTNTKRKNEFINIFEESNNVSDITFKKRKSWVDSSDQMSSDDELIFTKNSTVGVYSEDDTSSDQSYGQNMHSKYSSDLIGEERKVQNSTGHLESLSCSSTSDSTFSSLSNDFGDPKLDELMQDGKSYTDTINEFLENFFDNSNSDSPSSYSTDPDEEGPLD